MGQKWAENEICGGRVEWDGGMGEGKRGKDSSRKESLGRSSVVGGREMSRLLNVSVK